MAEMRRKLDAKHRMVNKTLVITGIAFFVLSMVFFIAMANSPRASGELLGNMAYGFICLIIGFKTFRSGCGAGCHCVKCCSNPSKDGLYCNGHDTDDTEWEWQEYEEHDHYDSKGRYAGYTKVPKK